MKILALEPYYGGSHRAFIDGWRLRSRHEFTLLTLPAHHWKWRMRHSAVTLAEAVTRLWEKAPTTADRALPWELIWCSSMLSLAEFVSLLPRPLRGLPSVAYFHENQLVYPSEHEEPRDVHFAFTNWTTACCADAVWFNSSYNLETLGSGLEALFRKMPDQRPTDVPALRSKSRILPPGIDVANQPRQPRTGADCALHIVWAARWEHDKNPQDFFKAIRIVRSRGIPIRLSVVGERFGNVPPVFAEAQVEFAACIEHFGYQSRSDYEALLSSADVIVSTANHEFFGISVLEAVAAGCMPLLPRRLVYPELFAGEESFYDGSPEDLAQRLSVLATRAQQGLLDNSQARNQVKRFGWDPAVSALDQAALAVCPHQSPIL